MEIKVNSFMTESIWNLRMVWSSLGNQFVKDQIEELILATGLVVKEVKRRDMIKDSLNRVLRA